MMNLIGIGVEKIALKNFKTLGYIFSLLVFCQITACTPSKPVKVPSEVMQKVYEEIKTPYKYGLVMVPSDSSKMLDCPSVFRKDGNWYMTYIVYDGRGYETWLAKSQNLLDWETLGRIMSFSDTTDWDSNQKAGYLALQNYEWGGNYQLQQYDDKYWMSYFGGNSQGYEAGVLKIGVAY